MAVYTHLSDRVLRQYLRPFRLGDVIETRGVSAGTVNTIYQVNTTRGRYILRLLENRTHTDARFEEALLLRLAERELPVPRMVSAGRRGHVVPVGPKQMLSVFQYLPGREVGVFEVTPDHTAQVGSFLALMHQAARGLNRRRRNRFDPVNINRLLVRCIKQQPDDAVERGYGPDLEILRTEMTRHPTWPHQLPQGIVHGDMFIDNVRFRGGHLCGVLDFEMAAVSPLLYDLAVAIGAWAFQHDQFVPDRAAALVGGYESKRSLKASEQQALYELCRFATARYAITRFYDFEIQRRPQAQRLYKDYRHFLARLRSLHNLGEQAFHDRVLRRPARAVPRP